MASPTQRSSFSAQSIDVSSQSRRPSLARASTSLQSMMASARLSRSKSKDETTTTRIDCRLGELFFALPSEIRLHILLHLSLPDIGACRQSCRQFSQLLSVNQTTLCRVALSRKFPKQCARLFPQPSQPKDALAHVYRLRRRHVVSNKLASTVADFITVDIMRRSSQKQRAYFESDRRLLCRLMAPMLFTLGHFFEVWRNWMLEHAKEPDGLWHLPEGMARDVSRQIMILYTHDELRNANDMHMLLLSVFSQKLRPPSYVGRIERSVRRLNSTPPTGEALAAVLAIGGIDQVARIMAMESYSGRCKAVDAFLQGLSPGLNVNWRRNWQTLVDGPFATTYSRLDPPERVSFPDCGRIWKPAAGQMLIEKGIIADITGFLSPRNFISELLGYDILRGEAISSIHQLQAEVEVDDGQDTTVEPAKADHETTLWWV